LSAALASVWLLASCSDSDKEKSCEETGTCGGAGAPAEPGPIECSGLSCEPLVLPGNFPPVAACCAEAGQCGLDASFLADNGANVTEFCQAREQPGDVDPACPASVPVAAPNTSLMLTFKGCCRAETGTCGYLFDRVGGLVGLEIGLGCVDSSPFLDGEAPMPCGGAAGAAGAAGSGG
jgi:hypothetical protein